VSVGDGVVLAKKKLGLTVGAEVGMSEGRTVGMGVGLLAM